MPLVVQTERRRRSILRVMTFKEVCFEHAAAFDDQLAVGDAIRWVGPGVWRVENVDGERVTVRLWPDDEPYAPRIRHFGPGEWPRESSR